MNEYLEINVCVYSLKNKIENSLWSFIEVKKKLVFLYKLPRFSDGKYHMTPDGELHVLNVNPQDGHSRFQCRTLHTLTGSTQLSVTPARIIVTG